MTMSNEFKISRAEHVVEPRSNNYVQVEREPSPLIARRATPVNQDGSYINKHGALTQDSDLSYERGGSESDYEYHNRVQRQKQEELRTPTYDSKALNKYRPEEFALDFHDIRQEEGFKGFYEQYKEVATNNDGFRRYQLDDDLYQAGFDFFGADDLEVEAAMLYASKGLEEAGETVPQGDNGDEQYRTTTTEDRPTQEVTESNTEVSNGYGGGQQQRQQGVQELKNLWGMDSDEEVNNALAEVQELFASLPIEERVKYDSVQGANYLYQHIQSERRKLEKSKQVPQFQRSRGRVSDSRQRYVFTEEQLANMSRDEYARLNDQILAAYANGQVRSY